MTPKEKARELANELFKGECLEVSSGCLCLEREQKRPLTRAEKALGWTRRPFDAYDANRLCLGCRAYFHAELAAQTLERAEKLAVIAARGAQEVA